ncbi:MAG: hypothetical protein NT005_03650 [Spirochaetes bacterium]|nr:hypothetical protein [Spirochaetota bacterium]
MKNKRIGIRAFGSALIVVALFFLSSCPVPIGKAMAVQVRDAIAPVIAISSPAEGSVCANIVEIVGTVTDAATESGNDGKASSLSYEVSGSTVTGEIQFSTDGTFAFQISTVTLGTNFTLSISAVDWNGNTAKVLLPLRRQSGSGIPSFTVSPGNQQATLTWDAVPHTSSYVLYYSTNGSLPSEQVGQSVLNATSPCVLSGLPDGNLHVFQLKAVPESGWPESVSDYIKTIPLSPQTLAPQVTGGIRQIRVEWDPIPATEEYEVWRSTEQAGTYYNLSGPIRSASFVDTGVSDSTLYWYKVRPTLDGCVGSFPNSAQTIPFRFDDPAIVATCGTSDASAIVISGSIAYIADGFYDGLRVIDISNPTSPALMGTFETNASRVAVNGNYAYLIAQDSSSLQVINISSSSSPTLTGSCPGLLYTQGVAVSGDGNFVYVADASFGLRVINVTTKTGPFLSSTLSVASDNVVGVTVSGTYLYLADSALGLRIYDISTPSTPSYVGIWSSIAGAKAVAVSGTYACVACGSNGLKVVDISTPSSPLLKTSYACFADAVAANGAFAFVADPFTGLRIIDFFKATTAIPPTLRGKCSTHWASGVAVSGSYAYVADDSSGLRVIDISMPSATPSNPGSYPTGNAKGVDVRGAYAYVANDNSGLQVIDITNPALPSLKGTCNPGGYNLAGVAVSGSYAYAADPLAGLRVIDVSNPASPNPVSTYDTVKAYGVAVSGSYVYAAAGIVGLQVVDISNPAQPVLIGTCSTNNAQGVAVSGSYAYVADLQVGLRVVDISDPTDPVIVTFCPATGATGVAVSGSYAYVANSGLGLSTIDISDPTAPLTIAGTCSTTMAVGVAVSGSYAYVADYGSGLRVIDISNPTYPYIRGTYDTTGIAFGVAVSGAYVYVSDGAAGLQVIDLLP